MKRNMKGKALVILMSLALAFTMMPQMAEYTFAENVKIDQHDAIKHAKASRVTQEYGPNTVYIQCEWEETIPTIGTRICQFHEWPLIVMSRPDAYYDGNPKEPYFNVIMMKDYPFGKQYEGFPFDYAQWDGTFTYTGINGTVEYGPTTKPPIGEGTYYVYATVKIPSAVTPWSDGTFIMGKTFTIEPSAYNVGFDANVPDSASTEVTGAMPVIHFNSRVETRQLPPNQFRLPGYEFHSWNEKPDGKGQGYANNALVKDLSYAGKDVTLFAKWSPKSYAITYNPGSVGGSAVSESALFDEPGKLKPIADMGWTYEGQSFLGWAVPETGLLLSDQEDFVNLGGPPDNYYGDPPDAEIEAQWAGDGQILIAVTKDGVPQGGLTDQFVLTSNGSVFMISVKYEDGWYVFDPSQVEMPGGVAGALPPGEYEISFEAEGYDASSLEFEYDGVETASAIFDYWTVSLEADPAFKDVHKVKMTGVNPDESGRYETVLPEGAEAELNTTVNPGYHFDGYSAAGVAPLWEDGDNMKVQQTIEVQGNAEIMAHVDANSYKVIFDANTTAPVIGKMEEQDMVYDEPQNLFANTFARSGFVFASWNTKADGTGKAYGDKERVKNLTAEDGGSVTLYAQWEKVVPKPDPAPAAVSGTLLTKMKAGKTKMTIGWNKIKGAAGYDIFFAKCNSKDKKVDCKIVKSIQGNKTFKWTKSGLKKGTAYKAYVKAYVMKDGVKTYVKSSPLMHAYTGNGAGKYTNAKSVTVKKTKVTLKKGKTFKIKAKVKKVKKNKKLMDKSHAPTLRYMTTNSKVATVNSKGKIKAKGKGTCSIYVFAHNGVSKKIKVSVK